MSNYIQALKRLDADAPRGAGAVARRPERALRDEEAAVRAEAPAENRAQPAAAGEDRAMAPLLDQLRTLAAQGARARVIVFAAVEPGPLARRVVTGLAARARGLDLPVAVGDLTRSGAQALLVERGSPPRAGRPLELDGAGLAAALQAWLEPLAAAQLVLIEAPPVGTSVDALLLAGACDGIVLVAETGATSRAALRAAADRVRRAGCCALGVVLMRQD